MKEKSRALFFMGILITLSLFNGILPERSFSARENRYLQRLPIIKKETIMNGSFGKDFEKYTTDQFIYRDSWISLKTISDLALLKKDNSRVYFGKDHYLFDIDEELQEEQIEKNLRYINKFLENIKELDKNISITALLVPSKGSVLKDKLPLYAPIIDEKYLIDKIKLSLKDNMEILSLLDSLNEKSHEDIYYRTDHHWTTEGAFYGYKEYLALQGILPLDKKDFFIHQVSGKFLGTNYRKANFYLGNPDIINIFMPKNELEYKIIINNQIEVDSLYDESYLNKTDKYSYFLGGDKALIEIETSIKNGKTILIFKDSFANSLIPFLTNHYEKLIIIDPRYFNGNPMDYIKGEDIDEVMFLFNIQNFLNEKSFYIFNR